MRAARSGRGQLRVSLKHTDAAACADSHVKQARQHIWVTAAVRDDVFRERTVDMLRKDACRRSLPLDILFSPGAPSSVNQGGISMRHIARPQRAARRGKGASVALRLGTGGSAPPRGGRSIV